MTDVEQAHERKPFDPANPRDALTHQFRTQVVEMALQAAKATIYRELPASSQLECFVIGVFSGVIDICFEAVKPDGRDNIFSVLEETLPRVREFVEDEDRAREAAE